MVPSGVGSFTKLAACPSSRSLLEYGLARLAPEMGKLIEWHLGECDFCWAEMKLLVYHAAVSKDEGRTPSMPVNLRVLAEALLLSSRSAQQKRKKPVKR